MTLRSSISPLVPKKSVPSSGWLASAITNSQEKCMSPIAMGTISVPKVWMDNLLTAGRAVPLEGVCLSLTEGGITLICAPESLKIYNLKIDPIYVAQSFLKGQPLRLLQVVGLLVPTTLKSMAATLSFQGQGCTFVCFISKFSMVST